MKIAVALKWIADLDSIDVNPRDGTVDASRLLYVLDPGSESALVLALNLANNPKEAGEVTAYTVGHEDADPAIRAAYAAGAHHGYRLHAEPRPALTAALLANALRADGPFDLVLLGTRSLDHGSGEIPALLAHDLGYPIVTDAGSLKAVAEKPGTWELNREVDRGTQEVVQVTGPAVFALHPGVARLATASLPNYMRAQQMKIEVRHREVPALAIDLTVYARSELPPRPQAQSMRARPPVGTPAERLASITEGAAGTRTRGRLIEGPPGEMADAIVTFLRERGLLDESQSS